MSEGWIKLFRQFQSHWIWEFDEPFDRRSAWIDLLYMANYKDNKTAIDGNLITVDRGQMITSTRKLADRWKWSRAKVTRFLDMLEDDHMIETKRDTKKTVITIVNYSNFQGERATEKPQKSHRKATEKPRSDTNKEYKECKEGKNISYSAEAEGADPSWPQPLDDAVHKWMQYRREIGRPLKNTSFDQLYKQIEKRLPEIGADRISEIIYFSISQGYQGIAWTALDERRPSKVYRESPATEKKRDAFFEEFQNKIITDRRKP